MPECALKDAEDQERSSRQGKGEQKGPGEGKQGLRRPGDEVTWGLEQSLEEPRESS